MPGQLLPTLSNRLHNMKKNADIEYSTSRKMIRKACMAQLSGHKYHLPQPCRIHASDPPTTIYRACDLFHLRDTARLRIAGSQAGRIPLSPVCQGMMINLRAFQTHRSSPRASVTRNSAPTRRRLLAPRAHRMDTWSQHKYRIPESFLVSDPITVVDSDCVIDAKISMPT